MEDTRCKLVRNKFDKATFDQGFFSNNECSVGGVSLKAQLVKSDHA